MALPVESWYQSIFLRHSERSYSDEPVLEKDLRSSKRRAANSVPMKEHAPNSSEAHRTMYSGEQSALMAR